LLSNPRLNHQEETEDATDLELFPPLFGAALDAERTTLHTMLIGLMSTSECIGYQ
jgi:hypothetical protein